MSESSPLIGQEADNAGNLRNRLADIFRPRSFPGTEPDKIGVLQYARFRDYERTGCENPSPGVVTTGPTRPAARDGAVMVTFSPHVETANDMHTWDRHIVASKKAGRRLAPFLAMRVPPILAKTRSIPRK